MINVRARDIDVYRRPDGQTFLKQENKLMNKPDELQVDLRHIDQIPGKNRVDVGINLGEFYLSVEWDLLEVPAIRNEEYYSCCSEPYTGELGR